MTDAERPNLRIGIDLGGTKIAGVAFRLDGGIAAELLRPTPRGDYGATIEAIRELVTALESIAGHEGSVGVGMPGSLSRVTGLVQNANSTWLNGRPFDVDLSRALNRPVRLANDANCFALSEAVDGAAAGARIVFGVILGTGCGGGLVIDGKVVDGPRGIAGEWGHNPLPWPESGEGPGPACWCGRRGCMEAWVSGPALTADYERLTGEALAPTDIAAQAARGNKTADAVLDQHACRLARGLAAVVNVIDPDVIVLGGGLSLLDHLYTRLPPLAAPYVFADHARLEIRPPKWGDASGVRGAAWLWRYG